MVSFASSTSPPTADGATTAPKRRDLSLTTGTTDEEDGASVSSQRSLLSLSRANGSEAFHFRHWKFAALVFLLGTAGAGLVLGFGLSGAKQTQQTRFDRVVDDVTAKFQQGFTNYVLAALWVHQAATTTTAASPATNSFDSVMTHDDFRRVYHYMKSSGIVLESIGLVQNISHVDRPAAEQTTRDYLAEYFPEDLPDYDGFFTLNFDQDTFAVFPGPSPNQTWYMPFRLLEPRELSQTRGSLDLDVYSLPPHREAVDMARETGQPSITAPFYLEDDLGAGTSSFVILFHPGVPEETESGEDEPFIPSVYSVFTVPIPILLETAWLDSSTRAERVSLYLFDEQQEQEGPEMNYIFMGGGDLNPSKDVERLGRVTPFSQVSWEEVHDLSSGRYRRDAAIVSANRSWKLVIVSHSDAFQPEIVFVIVGSVLLWGLCVGAIVWKCTDDARVARLQRIKADAREERNALVLENANAAARKEREMNDFVAHEVRNPLSAAMSACSFVKTSLVNSQQTLQDPDALAALQDDVDIISKSLQFINDLLRSMLDMHRANSNQLKLELVPTDLKLDVLEPAANMLYRRDMEDSFAIQVECAENLIIMADRLRLKQIVLNIGRNAFKFVQKGFVRFRAEVRDDGKVVLAIEDSGPGIPESKRDNLFAKFQESLDSLNQGTGIGLSLCKSLALLMGGDIWLDNQYDSGIPGCPGARFYVNINAEPLSLDSITDIAQVDLAQSHPSTLQGASKTGGSSDDGGDEDLPREISVLFVDDDLVLRKLFRRAIRQTFPSWSVSEAANGETALRLVDQKSYDVIFLDMYMSSTDKQMTGTETARALRNANVTSILCGLSANDVEAPFLSAGADCFLIKPFPVEMAAVKKEMRRILSSRK